MITTGEFSFVDIWFFVVLGLVAFMFDVFLASPKKDVNKNWANIVAAALPMVLGAVQAGMASRQKKQRPIYATPEAAIQALENQKRLASMENAPGTSAMLNQIRQSGAGATQTLKELGGGSSAAASGVSDIYAKELQALQGMQGNQQNFRLGQQQALNSALNQFGNEQTRAWEINQFQPYNQSMAAKSALTNSAMSNILGGLTGAIGTAGQYGMNQNMRNAFMANQNGLNMGVSTASPQNNSDNLSMGFSQNPWLLDPYSSNLPSDIGG